MRALGISCDTKVSLKLKKKFYSNVAIPTMLYERECWVINNQHDNKVSVTEIRVLRWMCSKIGCDKIRNDNIKECVSVTPIIKKMVEIILK